MSTLIFDPDYTRPPGDTLEEWLEEHGMSQLQLATRLGMSKKTVNQIFRVSPHSRWKRLKNLSSSPVSLLHSGQHVRRITSDENCRPECDRRWPRNLSGSKFPRSKKLIKNGLVTKYSDKAEQVRACLKYYHCASVGAWREASRKNLLAPPSAATAVKLSGKRT